MGSQIWNGWQTDCEIVRAVSDNPEGPFTVEQTVLAKGKTLPQGQFSPHNSRIKKIDGRYCLIYIVQTKKRDLSGMKIGLAISDSLEGEWKLAGHDGIVVQSKDTGWTQNSPIGTDNPDILKVGEKYYIYFKSGQQTGFPRGGYGVAISENLEGPYQIYNMDVPITDNCNYIEDATAFSCNGKIYLLSTDNFGTNSNTKEFGYGILWESEDGLSFQLKNAKVGFGVLSDYYHIPDYATYPYGMTGKFERPAILFQNGKATYFYAANGTNVDGVEATQNYVLKILS